MAISDKLLPTPQASDSAQAAVIGKNDTYYTTKTGFPRKINQNGTDGSVGLSRLLQLTSLQVDSPASLFPKPDEDGERRMTVTSGLKCLELYNSQNLHGSSLKMLVASLLGMKEWYSNKCALTWKAKVTKSNRLLFQLLPSTHRTEGIESGLLPTARVSMGNGASQKEIEQNDPKGRIETRVGVKTGLKLQPNFVEYLMGYPKDWTELPDSKLLEMRLSRKLQKKL